MTHKSPEVITRDLDKLAALIERNSEELLARWRHNVKELLSAKNLDTPTLNDHIPELIDELCVALMEKSDETITEALDAVSPPEHGLQRVKDGFDIEEVVAEYNILRGCIHDLAEENQLALQGKSFHILNRVLDGAIGQAVKTFAAVSAMEVKNRRDEHLAFVAHDLRTPLSAISLAASVLEREFTDLGPRISAAQTRIFSTLRRNVLQLNGLVGKVIEENTGFLPELGVKLERREFDLWPMVESIIEDLALVAQTARTRLIDEVDPDLIVYADAGLLRRVFQNVISNAIEYTPRGKVVIGARPLDAEGGIEVWVSDNGSGIPQDRLEKLFDKAETDYANDGGPGLGLAIARTFIIAHDGNLSVESKDGLGSTIQFTLPARQSAAISELA
jgi:signal transduction histidine kinase